MNSGIDSGPRLPPMCGSTAKIQPSLSVSLSGSGRSIRMFAKLKMTVFAPIASASVRITTSEKAG